MLSMSHKEQGVVWSEGSQEWASRGASQMQCSPFCYSFGKEHAQECMLHSSLGIWLLRSLGQPSVLVNFILTQPRVI